MPPISSDEGVNPASPILASTLLGLETDHRKDAKFAEPFHTDISEIDNILQETLWTGGKVIAIANAGGASLLAEHLIAAHLSTLVPFLSSHDSNTASTFVIAPPNTPVASNINHVLRTKRTIRSETARIQLLNTVQLMPYFDFAGLSESLSEVACRLHDLQNSTRTESPQLKRHVLFIDGLCPVLESTQRRSGPVQANALAASLLRSVIHLSRSHPVVLVLFNLEARWEARGGEELRSAFSSPQNNCCGIRPGGMLQNTLLAGIDTVVLLHNMLDAGLRNGDLIVEVVKDRTGASLGQWATWSNAI